MLISVARRQINSSFFHFLRDIFWLFSFCRLKQMIAEMDIAAADELKNNAQPSSMVHDILVATFMILGDENDNAKVCIKIEAFLKV